MRLRHPISANALCLRDGKGRRAGKIAIKKAAGGSRRPSVICSLSDTLQNEAIYQTRLSRSEHPEPVEGRSRRLLRQAQDASARLGRKVSGSEGHMEDRLIEQDVLTRVVNSQARRQATQVPSIPEHPRSPGVPPQSGLQQGPDRSARCRWAAPPPHPAQCPACGSGDRRR